MSVSKEFLSLLGSSLRSDLEKTMERISKTFDWDAATEIYEGKNIMNIVERLRERSSVALSEEDVTHFNQAADEIERLRLREETLSGIIDGMTARFIEAQGAVEEIERLREVLQKIADIEHEDIPVPTTPNEANVWTVLAMTIGLAEKALKEDK